MRPGLTLLLACTVALLLSSCTRDRTALPVATRYVAVQSAVQQDILARAVENAAAQITPPAGEGRPVSCSLVAVFPHADPDVNAYVRAQVEARLAASGWRVLPPASELGETRCVIAVSVAGADVREIRDEFCPGRVAANVFLQFPTLFTSWIWFPIHPTKRFYVSSTRLSLSLFPADREAAFWQAEGQGEVRILFDGPDQSHYPLVEGTTFRDVSERHLSVE